MTAPHRARAEGSLTPAQIACPLAASAEGYAFRTNLDRDPPLGGMAPKSQVRLVAEALEADRTPKALSAAPDQQVAKRCLDADASRTGGRKKSLANCRAAASKNQLDPMKSKDDVTFSGGTKKQ